MPLFHHHHQEGTTMTEATTAPLADDGTPIHSAMTTVPVTDPTEAPTTAPAGLSASQQDAQYQAFLQFQANQKATQDADAANAVAPPSTAHAFPSAVTPPEDVTETITLRSGTQIYVNDGRTFAVKSDGSTVSVEGDVYADAVAIATLFNL